MDIAALNRDLATKPAQDILQGALARLDKVALVSSFGADSVVLLHMISQIDPDLPVLFLETEMLFPETLRYQQEVAEHLGLTNVQIIRPDRGEMFAKDPDGLLHRADTNACCHLRKTKPLQRALAGYDAWITGRKRHQSATRAELQVFESEAGKRIKINPLADWSRDDIAAYIDRHNLPRHPLIARGYASIGCAPCTHPVAPGQDPRAGRWPNDAKVECGIHFVDGTFVRGAPNLQKEDA